MKYKVAVVGATGIVGSTLESILKKHPYVNLVARTSRDEPGYFSLNIDNKKEVDSFLSLKPEIVFITIDDDEVVKKYVEKFRKISPKMKIIDLSTAYRTNEDFVYGLPELPFRRSEIQKARLISNPGCYPTQIILNVAPLLIEFPREIDIITAVSTSSHTGAGKMAESELRPKYEDNIFSYSTTQHKHLPEIKNEFKKLAGKDVRIAFAPSAVWCRSGILTTLHIHTKNKISNEQLQDLYLSLYGDEKFIRVRDEELSVKAVRGTNYVDIYPWWNDYAGVIVVRSAIDNLMKGAAGQAVQNMNLMLGLDETIALLNQQNLSLFFN